MASWIKAAEDLFEVVDRKAKLVVSELADEHADSQSQASNGKESGRSSRERPKAKARKPRSSKEPSKATESQNWRPLNTRERDQTTLPTDEYSQSIDRQVQSLPSTITHSTTSDILPRKITQNSQIGTGSAQEGSFISVENESSDPQLQVVIDTQDVPISVVGTDERGDDFDQIQALPVTETGGEEVVITNGEVTQEKSSHVEEGSSIAVYPPSSRPDGSEEGVHPVTDGNGVGIPTIIAGSNPDEIPDDMLNGKDYQAKESDVKSYSSKPVENEEGTGKSGRIQYQLEEAQGLLSSAVSVGQSKEARLARVCAGLSTRLQEYKSENQQLEELLGAERDLAKSYEGSLRQMDQELSICRSELARSESNMSSALFAKNSEIESLLQSVDALQKKATLSEGSLTSLQANTESIMRNRDLTEARMMQALREELASAERRAEEERSAHNSTKMAFMEREVELEHRAVESSTALARVQRIADERTTKAIDVEQKMTLLEVEYASLSQELKEMEARVRRDQKKTAEEGNQIAQMQVWQEEVEKAHYGQRNAESKLLTLEAEIQKLRIELAAMKRDAEHYSRQEHVELEKRYRELTDLLYYKQTQLEGMAIEKTAAEFQLEKEMRRLQEVETERYRVPRNPSSSWEEDTDIKALEPLPLYHRHMATANIQLQKAAKLLDSGAVRATRFLWRYPTARVLLLFYLVFVHLFLMYLLHRLQEQADDFATRQEVQQMRYENYELP